MNVQGSSLVQKLLTTGVTRQPATDPATTTPTKPGASATPTKPGVTPSSSGVAPTISVPGETPELTIDGLQKAWGTDNANYDLNGDGTVNAVDLARLLRELHAEFSSPQTPERTTLGPTPATTTDAVDPTVSVPGTPVTPATDTGVAPSLDSIAPNVSVPGTPVTPATDTGVAPSLDSIAPNVSVPGTPVEPSLAPTDGTPAPSLDSIAPNISVPGDTPQPNFGASDLDGLLGAWGTNNGTYDLDGDGTVGPADLAQMLQHLADQHGETPDLSPAVDPALTTVATDSGIAGTPENPIDALLAAWGSDNERWDLNNDGTVNSTDLAQLLERLRVEDQQNSENQQARNAVEALLEHWGETGKSKWDLSGDGIVNGEDLAALLEFLHSRNQPAAAHAESAIAASLGTTADNPLGAQRAYGTSSGLDTSRLDSIATRLQEKLDHLGFSSTLPSNAKQILGGLNLTATEQSYVLNQLTQQLPTTFGVNVIS